MAFCKLLVSCLLGSPFGGAGTAAAVTERAARQRPAHSCPRAENEKVVKYFKKLGNMRVLFYTRVVKFKPRRNIGFSLYFTTFGFQVGDCNHPRRAPQRTAAALWPRGFTSTVISLLLERLESMSSVYLMSIRPPASPRLVESSLVNTPSVKVP